MKLDDLYISSCINTGTGRNGDSTGIYSRLDQNTERVYVLVLHKDKPKKSPPDRHLVLRFTDDYKFFTSPFFQVCYLKPEGEIKFGTDHVGTFVTAKTVRLIYSPVLPNFNNYTNGLVYYRIATILHCMPMLLSNGFPASAKERIFALIEQLDLSNPATALERLNEENGPVMIFTETILLNPVFVQNLMPRETINIALRISRTTGFAQAFVYLSIAVKKIEDLIRSGEYKLPPDPDCIAVMKSYYQKLFELPEERRQDD